MVLTVGIFKIELSKSHEKVSEYARKRHKHTLYTNPLTQDCKEETQNTNCQMALKGQLK